MYGHEEQQDKQVGCPLKFSVPKSVHLSKQVLFLPYVLRLFDFFAIKVAGKR